MRFIRRLVHLFSEPLHSIAPPLLLYLLIFLSPATATTDLYTLSLHDALPILASSTELSTTSQRRWCRPCLPVEPMYMPGRRRTGSSPSSTSICSAPY